MPAPAAEQVKASSASKSAEEILRERVGVLLGVTPAAQTALESLNIRTVFDLAASSLFATATTLTAAETDPTLAEARMNAVAADAVVPPAGVPVMELARQPISIFKEVGSGGAAALQAALDVATVRDLALWPPYRAAKQILQAVLGADEQARAELEAPPELRPTSGVYPTERVFYRKLLIDLAPQPQQGVAPIEDAKPIDINAAIAAPNGFQRIATGALLTFSQSWFSQGLTLGQLLHSTALAPGESTRIAMIDWSRRSRAGTSETISETEDLSNAQTHSRALSEVTNATATEFQSGTSSSTVTSGSSQSGAAFGLELGPLAFGGSGGGGTTTTDAMSASSSFGAREMASSLAQTVNDRSQQHASAARTRRASIVREVSQEEHEAISTRVVTNYNHMHALTVQYYEVVQAFRVTTQLERAERCLFVPLKLLDFRDVATIDRLRPLLAQAALTPAAFRQLTSEYGVVEVIPQTPRIFAGSVLGNVGIVSTVLGRRVDILREAAAGAVGTAAAGATAGGSTAATGGTAAAEPTAATVTERVRLRDVAFEQGPATSAIAMVAAKGFDPEQINRLAAIAGRVVIRPGSDSVFVPDEAVLLSVALRSGKAAKFQLRRRDGSEVTPASSSATSFVLSTPLAFAELQAVAVQNGADADTQTTLVLNLSVAGSVMSLDVPVQFRSRAAAAGLQDVVRFGTVRASRELIEHLQANRLHYSRAVFQRMDAAAVGTLLGKFSYRGVPLAHIVEPQPFAVTGNFLVFRMNVPAAGDLEDQRLAGEQEAFREFLRTRGLASSAPRTDVVPLPSGGVFAEAVLGRFNCAEKIDLKRFFNWQDSPIPLTATEIAPVEAGSRAQSEDLRPGQLGAPVVNIQTPTALPAAAGVGPALAAIQAGNMFRDMSGLAQSAALAQAAAQATGAGATAANQQAGKNLFTVMDQKTQRLRIAADLLGSMMGAGGGGGASGGSGGGGETPSLTTRGGQLNKAEEIDAAAASDPSGGAPTALQKQALEQQTGGGAAKAAEQVVEAAVQTPEPARKPALKRRPKSSGSSANSSGSGASETGAAAGSAAGGAASGGTTTSPAPEPVPRRYRMSVRFLPTSGVGIEGVATVRLYGPTGELLFGGAAETANGLFSEFEAAGQMAHLSVSTSKGLEGYFRVTLPVPSVFDAVGAMQGRVPRRMHFKVQVQPVLKKIRLMVPALGFVPDQANLDQQLTQRGITAAMRAGDASFEFVVGQGFRATVRYFTGSLLFEQRLS
jgi:hypothetical protein